MTALLLGPAPGAGVLVIGGCGGIGWALVEALRSQGQPVFVIDLEASLRARDIPVSGPVAAADLRDETSVVSAFVEMAERGASFSHVVIASGYTSALNPVADLDLAQFDDLMSANLRGVAIAGREALKRLPAGGSITAISTAIGQVGAKGYAGYAAAKAGLNALVRVMANEAAPMIRVNAVAPGAVDTAFIRGGFGRGGRDNGPPARFSVEAYEKMVPLGRIGTPDDIVGPLLFLMSDAARYITGQVLHVNGGAFLRD
jgi:3-oxoacyl-[acyl-carrier protein] reductase